MTNPALDLRGLLSQLAATKCEFVVIGSSALRMQGWEIAPTDLDLFVPPHSVEAIGEVIGVGDGGRAKWNQIGPARRLECQVDGGPVDIYVAVSGRLTYEDIVSQSMEIRLGINDLSVKVGSLEHVRDLRAAVGRDLPSSGAIPPASRDGTPLVIAIDGPAGAGKSTVARAVARDIGFTYLDTGAMYRCVTLAVLEKRADTDDPETIKRIAEEADIQFRGERVLLDGHDVTELIREKNVTKATPHIAAYPEVRDAMVRRQRKLFSTDGYVAEGRDTGTVVSPDAPLKIYLTASAKERAIRRARETGDPPKQVLEALRERDRLDSGRELSALKAAEDAVVIDTTGRSVQDVIDEIAALARERGII